jgi:hypothetical protein
VVSSAQRDRKLVARLTAQRSALRKAQVMGIRGSASANQAGLLGHISNMLTVTNPTRLRQRQNTLVNCTGSPSLYASIRRTLSLKAEIPSVPEVRLQYQSQTSRALLGKPPQYMWRQPNSPPVRLS